jgi:beta propeller repeat protein
METEWSAFDRLSIKYECFTICVRVFYFEIIEGENLCFLSCVYIDKYMGTLGGNMKIKFGTSSKLKFVLIVLVSFLLSSCSEGGTSTIETIPKTEITTLPVLKEREFIGNKSAIYGDLIVYENNYLSVVNLMTQEAVAYPPIKGRVNGFDIYGDYIVWSDNRNAVESHADMEHQNWDVFLYDIKSEKTSQITSEPVAQLRPRIWDNYVVWMENNEHENWTIVLFDLKTSQQRRITKGDGSHTWPDIDSGVVVWEDGRNVEEASMRNGVNNPNNNTDIYMYHIELDQTSPVAAGPYREGMPRISGSTIVWEDYNRGTAFPEAYKYDLTTNKSSKVMTSSNPQYHPVVDGDYIAWVEDREVHVLDLLHQTEKYLPGELASPEISERWISYQLGTYRDREEPLKIGVIMFGNAQAGDSEQKETKGFPESVKLTYEKINLEQTMDNTDEILDLDKHKSFAFGELSGEPIVIDLYSDSEDKSGNFTGLLKFKDDLQFIKPIGYNHDLDSIETYVIQEKYNELYLIGAIGSRALGYQYVFYNEKNKIWLTYHNWGSPKMLDMNNDGISEVWMNFLGKGLSYSDVTIMSWKPGGFYIAQINDNLSEVMELGLQSRLDSTIVANEDTVLDIEIIGEGHGRARYEFQTLDTLTRMPPGSSNNDRVEVIPAVSNPVLNDKCDNNVKHLQEISLLFVTGNIQYGADPEEVMEYWGKPCGTMVNSQTGNISWRYDFPSHENYTFTPASELSDVDDKGLISGEMKLQLHIGWYENKVAYFVLYYANECRYGRE